MGKRNPPALVEVTRGDFVESSHLVDIVVADADGKTVQSWGEFDCAIYPRSAIKSLQALPLVESGAAEAYGFGEKHLALACSSHNGAAEHVECAREMLDLAGVDCGCLECGPQFPNLPEDIEKIAQSGITPTAIHNNCSGKHSGFLAFAQYSGLGLKGYVKPGHPVQKEVAATLEDITASRHTEGNRAIDGCSIPTYRIPLESLAVAYARFGVGQHRSKSRAQAMLRLRDACFAHPEMVAGQKRGCTRIMKLLPGKAFVKIGAEGVYTASLPTLGLGVALKVRDGHERAAEAAVSAVIERFLRTEKDLDHQLKSMTSIELRNRNDLLVGKIGTVLN